ncbi:hypothetical protein FVEG_15578 [Fusarium verticillioides 7600]|uniref:Uncharacterized protein n=1 Tax=Gibberella moniliformis (strain M3125 / FGSC 7600) TaxID=334819 RepID=W7M7W0_GIBM7|nr:hypothetical protein FVEG_15578 [Fusarium verticillioides 7600]EWG43539.1 hypothetical protein FVEG_15578 [Fusarium verticillioides 7600]
MDSPEDSKTIADCLTKERYQIPQVPTAYNNGRQWHSRTRPEPAYLAHRPRRLPAQHGAVGNGLPLPQKSASASGSARQDPERDRISYKLKASPHLVDFFSPDDSLVATTLAELVASSDAGEEPMSEISAAVVTPSTSEGDPDPDSKGPTKVSQETELLYIRDWESALSYKHGPLNDHNYVAVSSSAAFLPNNPMKWRHRIEERNTNQSL